MAITPRKPRPLGRQELDQRDDRIFVIATEDTYAAKQYFESLRIPRLKIKVLETRDGKSSPADVLHRMERELAGCDLLEDDERWLVLDTDHWVRASHKRSLLETLQEARRKRIQWAFSNPCFEIWLLLHLRSLTASEQFTACDEVCAELQRLLGKYDKNRIPEFTWPAILDAVKRAQSIDQWPDDHWPERTGTHVYRFVETILKAARPLAGQPFPPIP